MHPREGGGQGLPMSGQAPCVNARTGRPAPMNKSRRDAENGIAPAFCVRTLRRVKNKNAQK